MYGCAAVCATHVSGFVARVSSVPRRLFASVPLHVASITTGPVFGALPTLTTYVNVSDVLPAMLVGNVPVFRIVV